MKVDSIFYYSSEFFYSHLLYVIAVIAGLLSILAGLIFNSIRIPMFKLWKEKATFYLTVTTRILDSITSFFPLRWMKEDIKSSLSITLFEDNTIVLISSLITLVISLISVMLVFLLQGIGQLWYVKILLIGMSIILPYYVATLFLDMYRYHISRTIPKLIDEFRSSFIRQTRHGDGSTVLIY